MRIPFLTTLVLTLAIGVTTASADFTSRTACAAHRAWDAAAGKCVACKTLVTDAGVLKQCMACKAGTAFDTTAAKCIKVTVSK